MIASERQVQTKMGSTSASLHQAGSGRVSPQGYSPADDAYKPIAVVLVGSSEYAQLFASLGATTTKTVTVSTSTDGLSDAVDLGGYRLAAVAMSTAWTSADITFAAAISSGGTFYPVYNDNGEEATIVNTTASRIVAIDVVAASLAPLRHVKLRSGTNDTPVTQAAARTLTIILKG